jgi:hypothetical protein
VLAAFFGITGHDSRPSCFQAGVIKLSATGACYGDHSLSYGEGAARAIDLDGLSAAPGTIRLTLKSIENSPLVIMALAPYSQSRRHAHTRGAAYKAFPVIRALVGHNVCAEGAMSYDAALGNVAA